MTLHHPRLGYEVCAVDTDAEFVAAVEERADGLPVRAERADARELDLGQRFSLAIAAMQFIQMIGAAAERERVLDRVAAHLDPGGCLGAAVLDGVPDDLTGAPAPLPDIREVDGRVYSMSATRLPFLTSGAFGRRWPRTGR